MQEPASLVRKRASKAGWNWLELAARGIQYRNLSSLEELGCQTWKAIVHYGPTTFAEGSMEAIESFKQLLAEESRGLALEEVCIYACAPLLPGFWLSHRSETMYLHQLQECSENQLGLSSGIEGF
jgi:hypothetical protein